MNNLKEDLKGYLTVTYLEGKYRTLSLLSVFHFKAISSSFPSSFWFIYFSMSSFNFSYLSLLFTMVSRKSTHSFLRLDWTLNTKSRASLKFLSWQIQKLWSTKLNYQSYLWRKANLTMKKKIITSKLKIMRN